MRYGFLVLMLFLLACGQKGALYLEGDEALGMGSDVDFQGGLDE